MDFDPVPKSFVFPQPEGATKSATADATTRPTIDAALDLAPPRPRPFRAIVVVVVIVVAVVIAACRHSSGRGYSGGRLFFPTERRTSTSENNSDGVTIDDGIPENPRPPSWKL